MIIVLRILGAALLVGVAVIHLYLWQQGYDSVEVIGPAFLLDTVLGFGGALLVLLTPLRWLPVAAALGALLCLGTLGALIASTTVGLFGFVESTQAQLWWESFAVEAAGFVVLVALAVAAGRRRRQPA
jgi:MYXO-CTERM domain-containing protein